MSAGFRDLKVWQRSKALAVEIYRSTNRSPLSGDFALRDQMRRATISVCSNLAEGDFRQTNKEAVQFFFIAKGSLAELSPQLEIAQAVHALDVAVVTPVLTECETIGGMIRALINHRRI